MPAPDPDLAAFARSGCADAFRRLVERHVDAVHSTASRLLWGWPADAADVAQSVFILLARKAPRLSPELVVGAWLHRQTVRHALNARRTETRRAARERTAADLLAMNATASSDPAAALRPHIDAAILALPEREREMLVLHYFEEQPQREIAARLGLSANAVQKRLTRALERVRRHLERRGATVTAVALAAWFSSSAVQAAPAALGASIVTQALPHAAAGSGFLATLINIMTHTKALTAGAVLGLAAGGLSADWPAQTVTVTSQSATSMHGGADGPPPAALGKPQTPSAPDGLIHPADTAEGLTAQLVEFAKRPDTEMNRQRMAAWMERIPAGMWAGLFALAPKELDQLERNRLLPAMAKAWARLDPLAAIPGLAALKLPGHPGAELLAGDAFSAWHMKDETAAQRWLVEHQEDEDLAKALPGFVSSVAASLLKKSEAAALAWAAELGGDDLRKAALQPLMSRTADAGRVDEWQRLCTALMGHEDESFARLAISEALAGWGRFDNSYPTRKTSTAESDKWLASLPPGPRTAMVAREILRRAIASVEQGAVPARAVAMLGDVAQEEARQLILTSKHIGPSAREWLLPLLTGEDREALIMRAARQVVPGQGLGSWASHESLQGTAIQWAAEISDPAVRDPLIYGLYRQWLQHGESMGYAKDFAGMWVESSTLPADVKAVIERARHDFIPKKQP